MPNVLQTNINSILAQVASNKTQRDLTKSMEKLSTGKRINKAGDDPAGLAVSTKFVAQVKGSNVAANNSSDAIAMIQTADGAMGEISNLMQRMRELAVQAATETYSTSDMSQMDTEYQELELEVVRIVEQTKWNTISVLDGSGGSSSAGSFIIQVGSDNAQSMTITIGDLAISSGSLGDLDGLAVSSQISASLAISMIDNAFEDLNTKRAEMGAYMNRLEHALNNNLIFNSNMSDSNSRFQDTDFGNELAEMAKLQILKQAGDAMLTQANAIPNQVLGLLQ